MLKQQKTSGVDIFGMPESVYVVSGKNGKLLDNHNS